MGNPEGQYRISHGHFTEANQKGIEHNPATGKEGRPVSPEQILMLAEGQEVPDSIRRNDAARYWTIVQMPNGTRMTINQWEEANELAARHLPSNADLGFPSSFRGLATADLYADRLHVSVEEVQRLYREERNKFHQLLDQHGLRVTVKPENL